MNRPVYTLFIVLSLIAVAGIGYFVTATPSDVAPSPAQEKEPLTSETEASAQQEVPSASHVESSSTDSERPVASISYLDIVSNPEFKQRLVTSVKNSDDNGLLALQDKALEIGEAAGLPDHEMDLLRGQRGLNFMVYLAKRDMFNQAFIYRYNNLLDIHHLELLYPEAMDLYQKARLTVAKRDALIIEMAKALADGDDYHLYLEQAREEWKRRQGAQTD